MTSESLGERRWELLESANFLWWWAIIRSSLERNYIITKGVGCIVELFPWLQDDLVLLEGIDSESASELEFNSENEEGGAVTTNEVS